MSMLIRNPNKHSLDGYKCQHEIDSMTEEEKCEYKKKLYDGLKKTKIYLDNNPEIMDGIVAVETNEISMRSI